MKDNTAYPGLIQRMRKGDFGSWALNWNRMEQWSEFSVCQPAQELPAVVTHARHFDHSGLRVECDDCEIRVHGLAQSLHVLEFALQTAEQLQTQLQLLVHVDVRIRPSHDHHQL